MSRKHILRALVLAGLVGVAVPGAVQAEAGPPCVDIVEGGAGYQPTESGAVATVEIALAAPRCAGFEYRIVVVPTDEAGTPIGDPIVGTDAQTAGPFEVIQVAVPGDPAWVCVAAEVTTPGGRHVFDHAPEDATTGAPTCALLPLDPNGSPGGGTTWR